MIKNNIALIHIDTLKREYFASRVLGQKLKKEGFNILLTPRHSTERLLKIFSPKVIDNIKDASSSWENENLGKSGELMAYEHKDFCNLWIL